MDSLNNKEVSADSQLSRAKCWILLIGSNQLVLEKVKEFLSKNYEADVLDLTFPDNLREILKYDVLVLVGRIALSYLAKAEFIVDCQIPIIGYELKTNTDERLRARLHGVISFVESSFEEVELVLAIETVIQLVNLRPLQREKGANFKKELLAAIKHLLEVQPSFNVEELCRYMKLSHSTLYRKVQETFEKSPSRLIAFCKLQQAGIMLAERDELNITEIAYACGFSSSTYLARQFKKVHGITPRQFRKAGLSYTQFVRVIE